MDSAIISVDKLESALEFLALSDHDYANEKAELERAAIRCKRCRARAFLMADGGNVETRKAQAEVNLEVQAADDDYCKSVALFEHLKAKRERAEIVVRVWQSLESTRRTKL